MEIYRNLSIKNFSKPRNSFLPKWIYDYPLSKVIFNGNCLKQGTLPFIHENVVNLYIFYELDTW